MAQAGLHGLVGMLTRKAAGKKEWLLLGVLLGSFIPDMDNLGLGLGLGMLLHSLLDLLLWFNGVALFWPLPLWINLWANTTPPEWFMKFMDPAEFLFFGLYLWTLGTWARKSGTDGDFLKTHRIWMILELVLFVIFTPLVYILTKGFLTLFGAFYLYSLFMAFFVTLRMRQTIATA